MDRVSKESKLLTRKSLKDFNILFCSQLYNPIGVYVSKKTGALYIVDQSNNRIQKWNVGDSQGVTIAGNPNGTAGMSNLLFNTPNSVALNADETYMFVADRNTSRIKMFELI
jgi:DNA-binding beta-propeller fold protein YncE